MDNKKDIKCNDCGVPRCHISCNGVYYGIIEERTTVDKKSWWHIVKVNNLAEEHLKSDIFNLNFETSLDAAEHLIEVSVKQH